MSRRRLRRRYGRTHGLRGQRGTIAVRANMEGEGTRAPILHGASPRADVIRWLEWNDPNGDYAHLTADEAWESLAAVQS